MATPVEMPKLGNTVEDCLLAKWTKAKGERVVEGDVIAEIETDKATFELPAPTSGVLLEIFFPEGALVPVFANICAIGEPGESVAGLAPRTEAPTQPAESAAPIEAGRPQTAAIETAAATESLALSPRAKRFAREHRFNAAGVRGSGPGGRILERDVRDAFYSAPRRSFLAQRLTSEGLEAGAGGSGINGMIVARDLSAPPTAMSGIREKIARRMRESLSTTAQYTLNGSADATALLALRARIKERRVELGLPDINLNELVLFCTVKALLRMPQLNAEFKDGKLYQRERVHLGFACDTDRGLMVPVLRDAHGMNAGELAAATKSLVERALKGALMPDDLSGATFTVSNLGSLGVESFTPVLNPPQVAILGVDAIQLRPVRRGGSIEFVDRIGLSLTCDHQVIDGAPGARFLNVVRECIEDVETLCGLGI